MPDLSAEKKQKEMSDMTASSADLFLSQEESSLYDLDSLVFVHGNTLFSSAPPYFARTQVFGVQAERRDRSSIISYKVEEGDSLEKVASDFGISKNTIKWANDINNEKISPGDELLILPVTGVMYYVDKGDTISEVASMHNAKVEGVTSFNNIKGESIAVGDRLIIPGGEPLPAPATPIVRQTTPSHFVNPVPGGLVTQGVHHYNAVDIHAACGAPIVATASGRVIEMGRGTWPAGNFVKIDHGNVAILYAHMQNIYVSVGAGVSQGQQIGTVGNTGYTIGSTGCHLHFDVLSRRIRNPFSHIPVGSRL